uniref:Uncharacterized protein n=1 Tax=Rhizophora mucronata TaxID=61149 RepID=A0A2P2PGQ7_RHIMU
MLAPRWSINDVLFGIRQT